MHVPREKKAAIKTRQIYLANIGLCPFCANSSSTVGTESGRVGFDYCGICGRIWRTKAIIVEVKEVQQQPLQPGDIEFSHRAFRLKWEPDGVCDH